MSDIYLVWIILNFWLLFSRFVFVIVDFTETQISYQNTHLLCDWEAIHIAIHAIQVILNLSQPEKWLDLSLSRSQSTSKRQIIFMISWELIQTTFRQSNKKFFFPIFTNCRISDQQKSPKNGTTEKEGTGIFYTSFNKKWFKSCGSFVILFRWRQLEGWIGSLYQWCF